MKKYRKTNNIPKKSEFDAESKLARKKRKNILT